jgi:hypothetical protein
VHTQSARKGETRERNKQSSKNSRNKPGERKEGEQQASKLEIKKVTDGGN